MNNALYNLNKLRNQFGEIKSETIIIVKNGVFTMFIKRRNRKSKKLYGELSTD